MQTRRGFIDYSLDKRATLLALFRGVVDACDADPYLIRAAKYLGDQLGQFSGRIKNAEELAEMEQEFGEFSVYVVEVCRKCSWNHLCATYLLGDGRERKAPRRQRTLEDEDFASLK